MKKTTKISKTNCSLGAKAVLALLLVALWGCDSRNTSVSWLERGAVLTSIIDDSLAIYTNNSIKIICTQPKFNIQGINDCEYYDYNPGLYLVNYRNKQVYWGDTLDYNMVVLLGHLDDSTVFVANESFTEYGYWKIGEKPKLENKLDIPMIGVDWSVEARPWKKGDILFYNYSNNLRHHWMIDSAAGEFRKLEYSGEDAWLESCIDFKYHEGEVFCVKMDSTGSGNLNLWVDGIVTDSLYLNDCKLKKTYGWYGPYVLLDLFCLHYFPKGIERGDWRNGLFEVHKVDFVHGKFDTTFSDLWISIRNYFAFDQGNYTIFEPEDLIVTGGE